MQKFNSEQMSVRDLLKNPENMTDDEVIYAYDTQPDSMHVFYGHPEYRQWVREVQEEYERRFSAAALIRG